MWFFSEKVTSMKFQKGVTLIELMVALVLSLLVMTGVIQIFLSSKQVYNAQEATSRMQEDGRLTLDFLNKYLRLAGFKTNPWNKNNESWTPVTADPLAVSGRGFPANANYGESGQVIFGVENDATNGNGVDTVRVRYQGSNDSSVSDCLGNIVDADEMADIFFSLSSATNGTRSLRCTVSINAATPTTQPLVDNIEDMQIWYGISTQDDKNNRLNNAEKYLPANEVTTAEWERVVSVRIALLIRSEANNLAQEPQVYLKPQSNEVVGKTTTPASTDKYLRYWMNTTINLRNRTQI